MQTLDEFVSVQTASLNCFSANYAMNCTTANSFMNCFSTIFLLHCFKTNMVFVFVLSFLFLLSFSFFLGFVLQMWFEQLDCCMDISCDIFVGFLFFLLFCFCFSSFCVYIGWDGGIYIYMPF